MWLFLVVSGYAADVLRTKNVLSTTNIRKLMNGSGQFGMKLQRVHKKNKANC